MYKHSHNDQVCESIIHPSLLVTAAVIANHRINGICELIRQRLDIYGADLAEKNPCSCCDIKQRSVGNYTVSLHRLLGSAKWCNLSRLHILFLFM